MGIFACEVNFLVLVLEKSAIADAEDFFDFSQNLVRDLFKCFSKVFSFQVNLVPLIVSQCKCIPITIHAYYAAISAWEVDNIGALLHVGLGLFVNDCSSGLDLTPCVN